MSKAEMDRITKLAEWMDTVKASLPHGAKIRMAIDKVTGSETLMVTMPETHDDERWGPIK